MEENTHIPCEGNQKSGGKRRAGYAVETHPSGRVHPPARGTAENTAPPPEAMRKTDAFPGAMRKTDASPEAMRKTDASPGAMRNDDAIPGTAENTAPHFSLPAVVKTRTSVLLFLFSFFVLFFNLWGRTVENKDYVRYPEISRRILEFSDWTVLHLNGRVYDHKPPLHFWSTAVAYRIFGVHAFAARVPSAFAALAGVIALYLFCTLFFRDKRVGLLAALALLSSYGYLWWSRRTRIDMVFSTFFSIGLLCFYAGWRTVSSPLKKTVLYLGFWGCLGCAFLTKAHIAFLALPVVLIFCLVVAFRRPDVRGQVSTARFLVTFIAFLLPTVLWVISLSDHPEVHHYLEKLDWTRLKKTMHQIHRRDEGPYYYIPQFLGKLAPFVLFFFPGLWGMFRYRKHIKGFSVLLFSFVWFLSCIVAFQLSSVKDDRYLLPLYMPCAVISAWAVCFFAGRAGPFFGEALKWGDRVLFCGAVCFSVCPLVWAWYYDASFVRAFVYVMMLVPVVVFFRKVWPSKAAGIFISFILVVLVVDLCDTARNRKASGNQQVYMDLKERNLESEQVVFFRCPRREHEVLAFYFNAVLERVKRYRVLFNKLESGAVRGIVTPSGKAQEVAGRLAAEENLRAFSRTDLERDLVLFYRTGKEGLDNGKKS